MENPFDEICFQNGTIQFTVNAKPVSSQNKIGDKSRLKRQIQQVTSSSEYIVTGTCFVAIDYYCRHINRQKNPGVYDIDNIIKPILDSLVGNEGVIVDDVLVDRITVNWIDTPHEDHFEVNLEYPWLKYCKKSDIIFIKSSSGWCYPVPQPVAEVGMDLIKKYFDLWNSIKTEEDYYSILPILPIQNFIYFSKIKDRGYTFIEI
jgi:hypothetical protein